MTTTDLDPFEQALLQQLRAVVVERGAEPARRRSGRWVAGGAAAAAVAAALVLVVPGTGPRPAWSVSEGNAGEVTVQVDDLRDADGLERALAEHGVRADVAFLPPRTWCAEDRYRPSVHGGDVRLEIGTERFRVTLGPGAVGDGETLVVTASVTPLPDGGEYHVDAGTTAGSVGPCVEVPAG